MQSGALKRLLLRGLIAACLPAASLRAEVILQYFNTSWKEIADKMPELAEAGYGALWLPPPTKGSGGLSVGYDCWDPFDLGSKDQRGSVSTRYGTEADLLRLIETAHRFGVRVYFDNIMNHRAFDVPGFNEYTPIDIYPGMVPEDFHLRVTAEGFYRKWDNISDWGDTWQIQYRNFSDLIDIAQESPDNGNFGATEGSHIPKIRLVRHPWNPEYYCYAPGTNGPVYVGFSSTNITHEMLVAPSNAWLYAEDVNAYLIRAVRWLVDRTRVDGLRLDAVKHVPDYFFGQQYGDKNGSGAGYCGQAQEQFNLTRGFSDWNNHRDSVFNAEQARDDLMMFGEHLGEPPGYSGYIDAGMRLVDSQLHGYLNGNLGSPWGTLDGLQYAGGHGFSAGTGVTYAKSHDDDYATRPELHYALNLTREGLPNIYTDGNYQAETLGESGGAFPRHSNTAFLGQFSDNRVPNLVYIHNHFARGSQTPRWGDGDVCAYERIDKREKSDMSDTDGAVLFFVMCDNYSAGQYREISTAFPAGAWLWQYSSGGGSFYYQVPSDGKIKVITPPGGYFAFSWRSPEESDLWSGSGGKPVTLYENGHTCGWVSYARKDGPDGDPAFNPNGAADADRTDYAYTWYVPRVTSPTNLRVVARVDGSAKNVLLKLDGGMDLNGATHALGDPRDNPPALATDVFLGYEQARFVQRNYREKFAARNTDSNNVIGSAGAETYAATIGSPGWSINAGVPGRDSDDNTAAWAFHDPQQNNDAGAAQFAPAPADAAGSDITVWLKTGYENLANRAFLYYTTDGATYPEGAGGEGRESTRVVELQFDHDDASAPTVDWWRGTIPALSAGTVLRYKIGCFKQQNGGSVPFSIPFPNDSYSINNKKSMMGVWEVTNFNAGAAVYRTHADYGSSSTGLVEGFHVLRARAFLERDNRASIYNTFVQPFYYDAQTPSGEVKYPGENDWLGQNEYGAVVRTDPTVSDVWFQIADSDTNNDDRVTGLSDGNGWGTNAQGQVAEAWIRASQVTPTLSITSAYPNEWRFSYRNIPSGGSNAVIRVRLLELSSSTNMTLSDSAGHFTTLVRNVRTSAPEQKLFFQWPPSDGYTVEAGWTLRVAFSKSLGDGVDDATLLGRFLVKVNGTALGRDTYTITRNVDGTYGKLEFKMPAVYTGDPNSLHTIDVSHVTGGGVTLQARRLVKMRATAQGPYVDIVNPPEYDSDGMPYEIILPDLAHPAPEDRQFTIRVETDLQAQQVWIAFTNSMGTAVPVAAVSNALPARAAATNGSPILAGQELALSGTVTLATSNSLVSGIGTFFDVELTTGAVVRVDTNYLTVTQIVSPTAIYVTPAPESTASNQAALIQPAFSSHLHAGDRIVVGGHALYVASVASSSLLTLSTNYPGSTAGGLTVVRVDGNPIRNGNRLLWHFLWTNMVAGDFRFLALVDTDGNPGTIEASAVRNAHVILREQVERNDSDYDDDDDGLSDSIESTAEDLPEGNSEEWNNGDVHLWMIAGRTDPLLPDSDGDGLPDGLELGWRQADTNITDITADTNGDGWPNFRPDFDPPFFNTVPDNWNVPGYVFNDSRTKLIAGSMTDPNNPDTDYDGIPDGIEDANRNGWVDGDGSALGPTQDRSARASWPDRTWDSAWQETDPNAGDTDRDGASDGYGEDTDFDGAIDGDTNSNRVWDAGELWTETNPLRPDTDADGLPDGWEKRYNLSALDDGVIGHTNMQTGLLIATNENGASGNPDHDFILVGGATNEYTNIMEYQNGTNPRRFDSIEPPPAGSIVIGPGPAIGTLNGATQYQEFADWTRDDLLVLDEYEGGGNNNQQGDLYLGWDGWDSSRDLVAFYAHDGGDPGNGGDGKFYFRADFHDLQAHAEEGNLDLYLVIDTGNPASGEMNLPDDVDAVTSCRWEVVVAVYQSSQGRVYVDTDRNNNTTAVGENLYSHGVVARDQSAANGFLDAYFSAPLDAVEFSISRQALIDAGWSGSGASNFNYQVFTTKDGTSNSPLGAGDIGGRNDIRDSIYDDEIAEDYWQAQAGIQNVLRSWIPGTSRPGRAKVSVVLHGNQAILPGSAIQHLVNTGAGAGYFRPLAAHGLFRQPVNLHVTPTLASAIEWAAADPAAGKPWLDGPALNRQIAALVRTNLVDLLGTSFSDHMLPYFTKSFNRNNEQLARSFLGSIYGWTQNWATVFWPAERLLDGDALDKILDVGYGSTVLDQNTHLFSWLGRTESLADSGYRINRINGVNCFAINDVPTSYRFSNSDSGLPVALRELLNRKARSGTQDQVVLIQSNWEDFTNNVQADAYDLNVRWIANRPWITMVTLEQVVHGDVDVWGGSAGDTWFAIDRGTVSRTKTANNWLNHATQGNYDSWYVGSSQEEGLENKIFQIRPGAPVPSRYGMLYSDGIVADAWQSVAAVSDPGLAALAQAALHASVFETAFHEEDNNDLRRYSTGDYMYPDTSSNSIAPFARVAQSQTRGAAAYRRVDQWAAAAASVMQAQTGTEDVDLDGEAEYLLYNNRVFAIFERLGGRMTGAWSRDRITGSIHQVVGAPAGFAGSETEEEGTSNVATNGAVVAYRTSGLKDWWDGSRSYANDLYTPTALSNGWQFATGDSRITKRVTLAAGSAAFEVEYQTAANPLYVRTGLSPNLLNLLTSGQRYLGAEVHAGGVMSLVNTNGLLLVTARVRYADAGHNASFNVAATDKQTNIVDFSTVPMRNQAMTHQVELYGSGTFRFALELGEESPDQNGNGLPDSYDQQFGLQTNLLGDASQDADGDGSSNGDEYIAGTSPTDPADCLELTALGSGTNGVVVRFAAKPEREYEVWYADRSLVTPAWSNATPSPITVPTNRIYEWPDDGTTTTPHPSAATNRFYQIRAQLP